MNGEQMNYENKNKIEYDRYVSLLFNVHIAQTKWLKIVTV